MSNTTKVRVVLSPKDVAEILWQLLDDIDALGDFTADGDNLYAFRDRVLVIVAQRKRYIDGSFGQYTWQSEHRCRCGLSVDHAAHNEDGKPITADGEVVNADE